MRLYNCLNCGKQCIDDRGGKPMKFCSTACNNTYQRKKHSAGKTYQIDAELACPYNGAVQCEDRKCNSCGWNPAVVKKRLLSMGIKEFEIYRKSGYMDLVAVIKARTYEEAKEEARKMGYGKEFRVVEVDNG